MGMLSGMLSGGGGGEASNPNKPKHGKPQRQRFCFATCTTCSADLEQADTGSVIELWHPRASNRLLQHIAVASGDTRLLCQQCRSVLAHSTLVQAARFTTQVTSPKSFVYILRSIYIYIAKSWNHLLCEARPVSYYCVFSLQQRDRPPLA